MLSMRTIAVNIAKLPGQGLIAERLAGSDDASNAVISGGCHVLTPGSQSKLVTTGWASKDANFSVAIGRWYYSH